VAHEKKGDAPSEMHVPGKKNGKRVGTGRVKVPKELTKKPNCRPPGGEPKELVADCGPGDRGALRRDAQMKVERTGLAEKRNRGTGTGRGGKR